MVVQLAVGSLACALFVGGVIVLVVVFSSGKLVSSEAGRDNYLRGGVYMVLVGPLSLDVTSVFP